MVTIDALLGVDIASDDYHTSPGVSNSSTKVFREDPQLYHYRYVLRNYDQERKDAFDFGSAVHDVCLLQDESRIVRIPESVLSKSGSKAGAAWKDFEAENAGKLLIKSDDYQAIQDCADAVRSHPVAGKLLDTNGPAEQMFWTEDRDLGLRLKCKPDKLVVMPSGQVIIVDLKTTESVNPGAFARSIVAYEYDCQRYFYERVLKACGLEIGGFVFVAVRKTPPYSVACYSISDDDMTTAMDIVEQCLVRMAECYATGDWLPKNRDQILSLTLPRYHQNRGDYRV